MDFPFFVERGDRFGADKCSAGGAYRTETYIRIKFTQQRFNEIAAVVDFTGDLADGVVEKITAITGVVRVRVI